MSQFPYDIAIIGAGIVGAALARELSQYDLKVALIDKAVDPASGTSKANSGIVHSGLHDHSGTLKARLCVEGNRLYPELCEALDVPYRQNGALVVARSENELSSLDYLYLQGRKNGVQKLSILSQDELRTWEPNLSTELVGALAAPTTGIVAPFELVFGLTENAVLNGVRLFLNTTVQSIAIEQDRFVLHTSQGLFITRYLVNAAGSYSEKIAAMIGDDSFRIRLRKGEEYLLDRRLNGLVRRTIFPVPTTQSKGILIIPTVEGNIMLGPTARETDHMEDLATSSTGWVEVQRESKRLVPVIQSRDLIASFAGIRSVSDRNDFIIEASPLHPKFIHAAGIQSPGLTAAPAIAKFVVELIAESGLKLIKKNSFHPERRVVRLRSLDRAGWDRLIAQNPGYGRMFCRCEHISEQEIREAIQRGAQTLDGIKLRTRCGMGRCQGGFCTPQTIKMLSEELGISLTEVTKKGPGSEIVLDYLRPAGEDDPHA